MKLLTLLLTFTFSVLFMIRVIEMSIQFDWIDVLWAVLFLLGAIITGVINAMQRDGEI